MILSFSFEGCFLFFFRSFYRFFYDRIRKAAALQGGHHKVAAAIGQLFHVAAAHQSGGSFQLRAFAVCVRGIDAFQRLLDLRAGKALLPQVLGCRTAALAGGKQAVCPGFGIAVPFRSSTAGIARSSRSRSRFFARTSPPQSTSTALPVFR